jgi:hypothetical protein
MIRRTIQYALLLVWLFACAGTVLWFVDAKYTGWQHIAFFVAGLGLGLVARDLLAPERDVSAPILTETSHHNGLHDAVTAPLRVGERVL